MISHNQRRLFFICLVLLTPVFLFKSSYAQVPEFEPKIYLYAGGQYIDPGALSGLNSIVSVPCIVDWDEDGKKDMLVGSFRYGNVYLYINTGDDDSPVFETETKLQDSLGNDIAVAYG
ncbi:MAG: hypothetical protein GY863_20065 [bacterium]|nr:hypothetical protein [bacterium]